MITNPKTFFQQIQNLCEEVALKIKAISSSLSSYLTKADAANTYLGKSETATRAAVADSATSADKATNDANGNNISNTYLKSTTAASTYLKQTDAQSKYLGKTAKAESAKTADTATSATSAGSATKAIQDGDGNVIANTYVKTINGQTPTGGNVTVDVGVTSVNGQSGAVTITPPDPYVLPAATGSSLGGVKIGSNISNSSGTISLSKANVTGALGYTPLQTAPVTSVNGQTGAVTVAEMGWIGEKTYTAYGYDTYTYTLTRDGYGRVSDFKYTHRDCDCTC